MRVNKNNRLIRRYITEFDLCIYILLQINIFKNPKMIDASGYGIPELLKAILQFLPLAADLHHPVAINKLLEQFVVIIT